MLHSLLSFDTPLDLLSQELASIPWESEELVVLKPSDLARMLDLYLSSVINADTLEKWTNLIEGRDDIGYPRIHETELRGQVADLANPLLAGQLTPDRARAALERVRQLKE